MKNEILQKEIRTYIDCLIKKTNRNQVSYSDNDIIQEIGLLDSGSIIQLIIWIESYYGISINEDEFTIGNLGSINLIAKFIKSKQNK